MDRRGTAFCIGVFLAARVSLSLLGWVGIQNASPPPEGRPVEGVDAIQVPGSGRTEAATPGFHNVVDGTTRWDASWFLLIAESGYSAEPAAAFFPGYPMAVRVIDELTPLGSLGAALLLSNTAFLFALIALYRLSCDEYSERIARRTVVLLTCFPTSFFFLAPYSESLFLFSSVFAFASARSGRWARGGIAGAVAWATRSIGATLVPALLLEAWTQGPPRGRRMAWALVPAAGLLGYLAWWWARTGDPLVPIAAQSDWHREPMFPAITIGRAVAVGLQAFGDRLWLPEAGDVILGLAPLVVLVLGWKRLPAASYTLYAALGFLIPLSFAIPERPLLSLPRFVIVLFPIAWLAALGLEHQWRYRAVLLVSISGWIGLSLGFMNWRFVA